jgi:purine-nucleoside phosphorylase
MKRRINPAATARALRGMTKLRPKLAIVLGSGFQEAIARMKVERKIGYAKLAGFPPVGVSGHAGKVVLGHLGGAATLVLSGRAHYYEGHSMEQVTFAMRVLAEFGIQDVLLTNAAGGVNRSFRPGDFMELTDHINMMGCNPLRGPAWPGRPRFVDLTCVYDKALRGLLRRAAKKCNLKLCAGVYLAVSGPTYETPAEVRAFAGLGADAVGMSTVPEAIVARQCGLKVAGMSCITNVAAGLGGEQVSHAEVLETAEKVKHSAALLLQEFAKEYGKDR